MTKKHIPVLVVGLLIVLVALAGGAVYGINKLIPSRKQMDLTEYYGDSWNCHSCSNEVHTIF